MALSNQATITLSVNVQGMSGLSSLRTNLSSLRTQIMNLQRSPAVRSGSGFQTPAQQARSNAAVQNVVQKQAITTAKNALAMTTAQQKGLAALQGAQARVATTAARLSGAEKRLAREMQMKNVKAREQKKELTGLVASITKAEEKVDALWRASFRLQMLGADFTRWGQNIFGAMDDVLDVFGEFEFMANRAAGTLGIFNDSADPTVTTTRDLQDAIMDTSKELRLFPAEDVAKAVYYWGSTTGQTVESQQDLENVMSSLVPIMKGAALTETDYQTAIKGTYGILSQYYGAVVETATATGDYNEMTRLAEEVTVRMFYATQKTALEFDDLIQAFKMVGPVAAGVGASFEDMVELMGRLGDLGIRGSMAGRSFRQMFMRMVSPPGPARKAIDALWRELGDSSSELFNTEFAGKSYMEMMFPKGEFVGTTKFMHNMTMAVKDLTTAERISFLNKFSTANLLPTMVALIGQETRALYENGEGYKGLSGDIEEMRAVFTKSWGLLENSWKGVIGGMERSIENLKITLGRAFADAFKPYIDGIAEAIDNVQEWVLANEPLMKTLGEVAGFLGGAALAVGAVVTAVGTLIGVFAGLTLAVEAFGGVFLRWTGYGLLIGSIVDSIVRNWDEFKKRVDVVVASLQRSFANIASYFGDGEETVTDFKDAFANMADTIVDLGLKAIETIAYFIEEISKWKWLFDIIKNIGIPVMANFFAIFAGAKLLMAIPIVGRLITMFTGLGKAIAGVVAKNTIAKIAMIGPQMSRTDRIVRGFTGTIKGLGSSLKSFVAGNFDIALMAVVAFGFAAYQNNWLGFKSIVDAYTESFRSLAAVSAELDAAFENIFDRNMAVQGMRDVGEEGGVQFAQGLREGIAEGIPGKGWMQEVLLGDTFMGDMAKPFVDVLFGTAINEFRNRFTDMWSSATFGARDAEEAVANVNKKLQDAGLSVTDFWKAWQYGRTQAGMSGADAGLFGEAFSRSMKDGIVTVGEMEAELRKLMGMSSSEAPWGVVTQFNNMGDSALRALGIMTRTEEAAQRLAMTHAADLVAELSALPVMGLSEAQFVRSATIIDELNGMWNDLTPEYQKIVSEHITAATIAGTEEGLDASQLDSGTIGQHLLEALNEIGIPHISGDTMQGMTDFIAAAVSEASANGMGEAIPWETIMKDAFSEFKIEEVKEWVYPSIQKMGEGVASAFEGIFTPQKFGDKLKDIVKSDSKGWKQFWTNVTDPILQAALEGKKGSWGQALAEEQLQGYFTGFETVWAGAAGPEKEKMKQRLLSFFNQDTLSKMSPAMQAFGANLLAVVYQGMGTGEIPEWLRTFLWSQGAQIPGFVQSGLDSQEDLTIGAPVIGRPVWAGGNGPSDMGGVEGGNDKRRAPGLPNIVGSVLGPLQTALANTPLTAPAVTGPDTTASQQTVNTYVTQTETALTTMNVQVPAMKAPDTSAPIAAVNSMSTSIGSIMSGLVAKMRVSGWHVVDNFAQGIQDNRWKAIGKARALAQDIADILKFSEPKKGPLRGLVASGQHLVENLIRGMHSRNPKIRAAAMNVARTVGLEIERLLKNTKKNGDKIGHTHKKIADDMEKTKKKMMDNVRGAHTFKNYDNYLAYLEKVHNRIKGVHQKVKKDRDRTVRDLTIGKNEKDSKIVYESKHKKVIEIRLIASSPDGTVDRVELKALRKGVMEGLSLAGLEHIVNVT